MPRATIQIRPIEDGHPARAASVPAADQDVIMRFKRITPENFTLPDLGRAFRLVDHSQRIAWFRRGQTRGGSARAGSQKWAAPMPKSRWCADWATPVALIGNIP